MQLESSDGIPRVRVRLTATMDEDGDIEEAVHYIVQADKRNEPVKTVPMQKHDRNAIQVHYLPARRDPTDHISYAANSLLGRALRAADWKAERDKIAGLTQGISQALAGNAAVDGIGEQLTAHWAALHKGTYYASPSVSFERSEIDNLLRHLTVGFTPGPGEQIVDFSRLSDGQQSLLYISLVLSLQAIGRQVLAKKLDAFDVDKLRPAVFTLIAMEEPENNSLSPHYLGRSAPRLRHRGSSFPMPTASRMTNLKIQTMRPWSQCSASVMGMSTSIVKTNSSTSMHIIDASNSAASQWPTSMRWYNSTTPHSTATYPSLSIVCLIR